LLHHVEASHAASTYQAWQPVPTSASGAIAKVAYFFFQRFLFGKSQNSNDPNMSHCCVPNKFLQCP
jgi:hypothetical protein